MCIVSLLATGTESRGHFSRLPEFTLCICIYCCLPKTGVGGDAIGELILLPPAIFNVFGPEKLIISKFGSLPTFLG